MLVISCYIWYQPSSTSSTTILAPKKKSWMRHVGEGPSQPAFALRPNYKKPRIVVRPPVFHSPDHKKSQS